MNEPPALPLYPPLLRDQRKIDANHLKMLAIFHFVYAGLAVFALMFLFLHFMVFHTFFANPKIWENQAQKVQMPMPPQEFFEMFKWFYVMIGLWFIFSGVMNLISGIGIRARKWRIFSLVNAGLNCLHMPLGTILGAFTFIVLLRESVEEVYVPYPPEKRWKDGNAG